MESSPIEPVVGDLQAVWASTASACRDLSPEDWENPTACPGWSVKDQLSHVVGIERTLLGEALAPLDGPRPDYVRNEVGAINEGFVAPRRARTGDQVLAEFLSVTTERSEALSAMGPADFDRLGPSPVGTAPYRHFMALRVVDCWIHEQDIREALGLPGGRGGAGERLTVDHLMSAMPYVVGKKVAPGDGVGVGFDIVGPSPASALVAVTGGRAERVGAAVVPATTLRCESLVFTRLASGRLSPRGAVEEGLVTIGGERGLGRAVLEAMNVMA